MCMAWPPLTMTVGITGMAGLKRLQLQGESSSECGGGATPEGGRGKDTAATDHPEVMYILVLACCLFLAYICVHHYSPSLSSHNLSSNFCVADCAFFVPHPKGPCDNHMVRLFLDVVFSKISQQNGCGKMRAAAVMWQSPISSKFSLQTGLGRARTRGRSDGRLA